MMAMLKTLIWGPEPPPPNPRAYEVMEKQAELVGEILDIKRTSSEIRREIAGEALDFIARKPK